MAKAGFFYFNHTDHVRCAWCQGAIAKWEIGDNPFTEHLRFFPQCSRAQLGPNVELQSEESIRSLGIQQIRPPKKERYSSLDARIRSFNNWPMAAIQAPETLAMAGFYYQNTDDQVLCFQCNGGLRSWQPEDDAWFEHARWFPKCEFVQLVKGQQYIAQVQAQTRPTIDEAMASEAVQKALQMGLNENHIQCVTKYHLEHFDGPFKSAEALVDIVLDYQRELEQLQNCDEENAVSSQNNSLENGHHINQILDKIFKKNRISPIQSSSTSSNTSFTNSDVSTDENESGTEDFVVLQRPQTLRRRTSSDLLVENQNVLPMHHSTSPTQYIANRSDTSENRNLSRSLSINMHVEPSSSCTNVIPKCNLESPSESIASNASNATSTSATTVQTLLLKEKIGLSLEEENRQLKDARLCKVCMDDDVAVVFLPCGHLGNFHIIFKQNRLFLIIFAFISVTCVQCAPSVTVCPLCRTAIKAFVRTFLS